MSAPAYLPGSAHPHPSTGHIDARSSGLYGVGQNRRELIFLHATADLYRGNQDGALSFDLRVPALKGGETDARKTQAERILGIFLRRL